MNDREIIELYQKLKRKKTIKETADLLGVNPSYISNVISDKCKLSEKILTEMARTAGPQITEAWGERCKERIRAKL